MRKVLTIIVAVVLLVTVGIAHGGIRCPRDFGSCLANIGDDNSVLYSCCGAPDMQSNNVKVVKNNDGAESVNIDVFTYNCGDGRFIQKITMENDKIKSIENAGWGSGPQKCD